jgi:hypothetical protein
MKESTGLEVRLVGRHAELNIDTGPPQALHANERGTGSRVTGRAAHARKRHAADTAHLATRQAARAPSRDQAAWQQGPECLARCHCRSGHTGRTATASLLAWCGVHMSVSRFGLAGTAPSSQVWRSRWRARRRPRARAPAAAPRCCRCGSPPRCCLRAEGLPRPCLPHVRRTPDAPEGALQPHTPAFIHMRNT